MEKHNITELLSKYWKIKKSELKNCVITTNNPIENYRWTSLINKEPETIEWIKNMNKNSVLCDIGANIGVYSISALIRGISHVYCFEPYNLNFKKLVDNLQKNSFLENVNLFCFAIGQNQDLIYFHHKKLGLNGIAEFMQNKEPKLNSQPVVSLPMSNFASLIKSRKITHLKIDVDGPEIDVLRSCENLLLKDSKLESVLIETSIGGTEDEIIKIMYDNNFEIDQYYEYLSNHSKKRRSIEKDNIARNIIFKRR